MTDPSTTTEGTLFDGALHFAQPATGYRAAVDGLLLAYFAPSARRLAVDLGAGAGMISLALLAHGKASRVLAIEASPAVAAICAQNFARNGLSERGDVRVGRVEDVSRSFRGAADLVVANPPFYAESAATRGADADAERALRAPDPLGPFVRAGRSLLGRGGRMCVVFPARDLETLLAALASKDLHARRLVFVHPFAAATATRALVECSVGRPGGLQVEPPWVLYEQDGDQRRETALLRRVTRDRPATITAPVVNES